MRKKFLLMFFALLGTAGAWAGVQVTYVVTLSSGTCYKIDNGTNSATRGQSITVGTGFGNKFVSSDDVLTFETVDNTINWGHVKGGTGFRINHNSDQIYETSRKNANAVVCYTLSVLEDHTIVSYTFGANPNGDNNNAIKISKNEGMTDAVTVQKEGTKTEHQETVNARQATFYLQHEDSKTPIDVTLTVVVDVPIEVRDYLTEERIANVACAGEYGYPKKTTDSYKKIQSLIEKLDDVNAEWTEEDYENVAFYYEDYIAETDIVIPETGKFYRIYASHNGNNKFLLASGNKIIGRRAAGQTLANEASSIWYLDKDDKYYKLTAFSSGYQYAGTETNINVMGYEGGTKVEFIRCPAEFGKVSIRSNGSLWLIEASQGGETDLKTDTDSSKPGAQFYVEEVNALPITISEAGLATFYSPVAVTVPEGVTAYTGVISEDGDALNLTSVKEIPANTAVILEMEGEGEVSLPIAKAVAEAASVAETVNEVFTGTISTIATPEGAEILTLQNRDGKTGFYPYNGETLAGFKAYLNMTTNGGPAGVKGIDLNFGMTDAIREIVKDDQQAEAIYDLTGRRVEKAVKGIYIVNGKKTVIK